MVTINVSCQLPIIFLGVRTVHNNPGQKAARATASYVSLRLKTFYRLQNPTADSFQSKTKEYINKLNTTRISMSSRRDFVQTRVMQNLNTPTKTDKLSRILVREIEKASSHPLLVRCGCIS